MQLNGSTDNPAGLEGGLADGEGVGEGVGAEVGVGLGLEVGVGEGDRLGVGEGERVGVGDGLRVGVGEGVAEGKVMVKVVLQAGTGLPSMALGFSGAVGATGFSSFKRVTVSKTSAAKRPVTTANVSNAQFFFKNTIICLIFMF